MRIAFLAVALGILATASATPRFHAKQLHSRALALEDGPAPGCYPDLAKIKACAEANSTTSACCDPYEAASQSCGAASEGIAFIPFLLYADYAMGRGGYNNISAIADVCPLGNTSPEACAMVFPAVAACLNSSASHNECCATLHSATPLCLGLEPGNPFFTDLFATAAEIGCPAFPAEVCAASVNRLAMCLSLNSDLCCDESTTVEELCVGHNYTQVLGEPGFEGFFAYHQGACKAGNGECYPAVVSAYECTKTPGSNCCDAYGNAVAKCGDGELDVAFINFMAFADYQADGKGFKTLSELAPVCPLNTTEATCTAAFDAVTSCLDASSGNSSQCCDLIPAISPACIGLNNNYTAQLHALSEQTSCPAYTVDMCITASARAAACVESGHACCDDIDVSATFCTGINLVATFGYEDAKSGQHYIDACSVGRGQCDEAVAAVAHCASSNNGTVSNQCCATYRDAVDLCGEGNLYTAFQNFLEFADIQVPKSFNSLFDLAPICPYQASETACVAAFNATASCLSNGSPSYACCDSLLHITPACLALEPENRYMEALYNISETTGCFAYPAPMCYLSAARASKCLNSGSTDCCDAIDVTNNFCTGGNLTAIFLGYPGGRLIFDAASAVCDRNGGSNGGHDNSCNYSEFIPDMFSYQGQVVTRNMSLASSYALTVEGVQYYFVNTTIVNTTGMQPAYCGEFAFKA